jgi:hypothetical protein
MLRHVTFGGIIVLCAFLCSVLTGSAAAVGDATSGGDACPNEASPGFRASLPDCRAYEQVTPVFKDGVSLGGRAVAENGSGVIAHVLGGFAGIEGSTELAGATYQLSRSSTGWAVTAISPPSALFPAQMWLVASPELSSTLWIAHTPAESIAAENLYIRDESGTMEKIGPLLPPSFAIGPSSGEFTAFLYGPEVQYRGASADLSHVLFALEKPQEYGYSWPGDATTGDESLYEYVGRGQVRPELVGVDNEGHLISTCSTYLGSFRSGDVYNALSADGSVVFFTAEDAGGCGAVKGPVVNELYARVDQIETVPISEPTTGAGGTCIACNDSEPKPAQFAGASQNGSKVFFLTEQELLPGASKTGDSLYEYDFDAPHGFQVSLASPGASEPDVQGVARVSEDGSHVYFVAQGVLTTEPDRSLPAGHQQALAGGDNLYVYQRDVAYPAGHVSFIATLCSGTETSGSDTDEQCQSPESDEGDWSATDARKVQATPDGRFLVFRSAGDLTPGDTSDMPQVFEYDAQTGELVWVSRPRAGYTAPEGLGAAESSAEFPGQAYSTEISPSAAARSLEVSSDGSIVVFNSMGALTSEAEQAAAAKARSAYEYESSVASGGTISNGNVYYISGEGNTTPLNTGVEGLDASGQDIFFQTAAPLVPQDTDTQNDIYDARENGGFLAPDPPAECIAEACTGPALAPSLIPSGATSAAPDQPPGTGAKTPVPTPKVPTQSVLTRRQRLARALRACIREPRHKRAACETAALKRYGVHTTKIKPTKIPSRAFNRR